MNRVKEEVSFFYLNSQDWVDYKEWEMVFRYLFWGDVGVGGSFKVLVLSLNQGMDNGRSILVEVRDQ